MAAKDSINSHLFDSAFQRLHGISLQQAQEGWAGHNDIVSRSIGRPASPEEQDEWWDELKRTNSPFARHAPEGPVREVTREMLSTPHPVEDAAHDWMMDHTTFLVGASPQRVAHRAIALSNAVRGGQAPTNRLYRGAVASPQEMVAKNPDLPVSFTEDQHVARSFARPSNRGPGGRIFKVDPTTERGLFIPDLVGRERTVGQSRRPEREWLIDPNTISGR